LEYPVIADGISVGTCQIEDLGLYWEVRCNCRCISDRVERLYCGKKVIGVLLLDEGRLVLRRRLSKVSVPELPPQNGLFSLRALPDVAQWSGSVFGHDLDGIKVEDDLCFPYYSDQPCPCEPLICFFKIDNGFWKLNLKNIGPVQP